MCFSVTVHVVPAFLTGACQCVCLPACVCMRGVLMCVPLCACMCVCVCVQSTDQPTTIVCQCVVCMCVTRACV